MHRAPPAPSTGRRAAPCALPRLRLAAAAALLATTWLSPAVGAAPAARDGALTLAGPGNSTSVITLTRPVTLRLRADAALGATGPLHADYLGFLIGRRSDHHALFGQVRLRQVEHAVTGDRPAPLPLTRTFDITLTPGSYQLSLYGHGPVRITLPTEAGTANPQLRSTQPLRVSYQRHHLPSLPSPAALPGGRYPLTLTARSVLIYGVLHLSSLTSPGAGTEVGHMHSNCLAAAGAPTCLGARPYLPEPVPDRIGVGVGSAGAGFSTDATASFNNTLPGEAPAGSYDWLVRTATAGTGTSSTDYALSFLSS